MLTSLNAFVNLHDSTEVDVTIPVSLQGKARLGNSDRDPTAMQA